MWREMEERCVGEIGIFKEIDEQVATSVLMHLNTNKNSSYLTFFIILCLTYIYLVS